METHPFDKSAPTRELYDCLLSELSVLGPIMVEVKKTSAHIVAGKGAFLGVHPRASGLLLNIVLDRELVSPRVSKSEHVSALRYHNEVKIASQGDLNEELMSWVRQAYQLKVGEASNS